MHMYTSRVYGLARVSEVLCIIIYSIIILNIRKKIILQKIIIYNYSITENT